MKNIGKPCAGEPHARFDEGGQARACSLLYPFFTGISDPATPNYRADLDILQALRLATQDIKAYYQESASAQPGARVAHDARDWFWRDTAAGKAFLELRDVCLASSNEALQRFGARNLIPLAVSPRPKGAP